MDREATLDALAGAEQLYDGATVAAAIERMAEAISADLSERMPVVLCVLVGALIPTGRLLPKLAFPLDVDYVHATRYRGATDGGEIDWIALPRMSLSGRTVLIVDDILDEGHTLDAIIRFCRDAGADDVRVAALVRKRHDRCLPGVRADYIGLEVEDRYVFGEGMDYRERLRNVSGIYAID